MIRLSKILKKTTILLMISSLLIGCGKTENGENAMDTAPELVEPEGAAATYEVATYKNLYTYDTYEATVDLEVTDHAFHTTQRFSNYTASPGQKVEAGTPLIYGLTDDYDKQIKAALENIQNMEDNQAEYVEVAKENLEEPTRDRDFYKRLAEEYKDREPEFTEYGTKYQDLYLQVKMMEEELRQHNELYEIDHAYQQSEYERLEQKKNESILYAKEAGVVCAIRNLNYGDIMDARSVAIAIANPAKKRIHCDYISKADINRNEELYFLYDGVKYEVEYEPMDMQEYNRRIRQNEKTYSTFKLLDDESIPVGSYGIVVVVKASRTHVLTVSQKAIHKDGNGYFVYKLVNGESIYTPVVTGMTDNIYTEILEGLSEGDQILTADLVHGDDKQITVEMGSISTEFVANATTSFPIYQIVKNPVKYGTCYFKENLVKRYQQVSKGEVLAKVLVVPDEVTLQRKKTRIERLQQRLSELNAEDEKEKNKKIKNANRRSRVKMEKEIAKLTEEMMELQNSYQVTEIVSPIDGMIISQTDRKEEEIVNENEALYAVAALNTCYLKVDNQGHTLHCGNEVEVTYSDKDGNEKTTTGEIVTMDGSYLSKDLVEDEALIKLPAEVVAELSISQEAKEGTWSQSKCKVRTVVKKIDHILVVPKQAVTMMHGQTYVKVKSENGEITFVSFIPAGFDLQNYGVIEGLTEGMKICSK